MPRVSDDPNRQPRGEPRRTARGLRALRHAFAVDAPGPAEPAEDESRVVDQLCRAIVRRKLATPTLMYLELARPLNYLGSQALHFFKPVVSALADTRGYDAFARFLERRGSVDYLFRRIDELQGERQAEEESRRRGTSGPGPRSGGRASTLLALALAMGALVVPSGLARAQVNGPTLAPPAGLMASDHPLDGGAAIDLRWNPSPEEATGRIEAYVIHRSMTEAEIAARVQEDRAKAIREAREAATTAAQAAAAAEGLDPAATARRVREARATAGADAAREFDARPAGAIAGEAFTPIGSVKAGTTSFTATELDRGTPYRFRIEAISAGGERSPEVITPAAIAPRRQWIDGSRLYLLIMSFIFCGSVIYWIQHARRGRPLNVRKIAGLEAVDEAVGRATEMGRPCLYIPGTQDMNEMQTIASMTVLARVARTAANYNARVEVPTSRSLVMTTARETVHAAFLAAGRPDAYHQDLIYYVTDEQFGYVAYLTGLMVRDKPAACFYMGAFFAESLILAETGNSIGAIQVAGTAQPAQLPFFVAACDYTLIGEEFFAASAYLSGSPEELGSLKGQDVGKMVVGTIVVAGVLIATLAALLDSGQLAQVVEYLRQVVLT